MEFEEIVKLGAHLKYLIDNLSPNQILAYEAILVCLSCLGTTGFLTGFLLFYENKDPNHGEN